MTSDTEFIPVSTIFNETGIFSNAIRWFGKQSVLSTRAILMGQLTLNFSVSICSQPEEFTVPVWHGIHSLECTEHKKSLMCMICRLHSTRTRFQSSASTTDNPQRSRISLVSLAIVHLGLEALIACDYHFLWHFFVMSEKVQERGEVLHLEMLFVNFYHEKCPEIS